MGAFTSLVYGWMTGIIGVVLCILYGFDVLLFVMRLPNRLWSATPLGPGRRGKVLSSAADALVEQHGAESKARRLAAAKTSKQSLRDQGLEGVVAGTATEVSQLKLSSTCTMSWYEDDVFGAPVWCRFVLTGSDLFVYELLPAGGRSVNLEGGGGGADGADRKGDGKGRAKGDSNDRDAASAEHLRGITSVTRLQVRHIKIKTKDKAKVSGPFTGHILVLSTLDHQPVVGARDPTDPSGTAGHATPGAVSPQSPSRSPADRSLGGGGGAGGDAADSVAGVNASSAGAPGDGVARDASRRAINLSRRGMSGWTSVAVKFRDNRETERWSNTLSGVKEAEGWREFAKTLPNPDTANTLIARFLFQNIQGDGLAKAIMKQVQKKLRKLSITKFPRDLTGEILLDDFVIGKSVPWISDVSEPTVSTNGEFGFDFNLHYNGEDNGFTLFFRLALAYRDIRIPHVIVSLKLHELEGTVHMSIGPPPSKKFWIAGRQPPVLRVEVHQGCAIGRGLLHRILTSLPDLSGIITNLLKLFFLSRMVLPYMDDFPLPNFESAPKAPPSASPKTRVFDRKRAAAKSAAPDTAATGAAPPDSPLVRSTTAIPAAATAEEEGEGQGHEAGAEDAAAAAATTTPPSLAALGGQGRLSPSARLASSGSRLTASPSTPVSAASPMWASTPRRGAPGPTASGLTAGLDDILSGDDDGVSSRTDAARSQADGSTSARGGPVHGRPHVSDEAAAAAAGDAEDSATTVTCSSGKELPDGTRKARKNKFANLRSVLKTKGVDMDRAAVAKTKKRK